MNPNMTLLAQAISFAIFVVFTMKFVWPPLIKAIEERQKKIADGLAASERGQHDLDLAKKEAGNILKDAKHQAAEILEHANKRGVAMVEEAKAEAKVEADRVKAGALAELEQEVNRAKEALRGQVASLAVAGAEKILARNIDASAQADLVEKLVAEL
ncbi:MAG: F0F1 ATP synthase subunit B [Gammaproteobacteria bacterium]|nr:F0F1 ATP synthase subunit B [Gammaproteobacteria bacterium]